MRQLVHNLPRRRTLLGVFYGTLLGFAFGLYINDKAIYCTIDNDAVSQSVKRTVNKAVSLSVNQKSQLLNHLDLSMITPFIFPKNDNDKQDILISEPIDNSNKVIQPHQTQKKKLLLVGVLTASKYFNTRAKTVFETWAKTIPGKVLFFSSEGSEKSAPGDLPIIALHGVDNIYPPQKKCFFMLEYMYKHYAHEYEWFMRADDDVFIKGDKLELFLRTLNSSKLLMLGQAGYGKKGEEHKLDINAPYCQGGPGVIFSSTILQTFLPHIQQCLKEVVTKHEDVEIGRCVTKYTGIACTAASEMTKLFYQNYKEPNGSFENELKSQNVEYAITLHPVKNYTHQHRINAYIYSKNIQKLRHRTALLLHEIKTIENTLDTFKTKPPSKKIFHFPSSLATSWLKSAPNSRNEVLKWNNFEQDFYSADMEFPKIRDDHLSAILNDVVTEAVEITGRISLGHLQSDMVQQELQKRHKTKILTAYMQLDPYNGVNYIIEILLFNRIQLSNTRATRIICLHQPFTSIEFSEDEYTENRGQIKPNHNSINYNVDTLSKTDRIQSLGDNMQTKPDQELDNFFTRQNKAKLELNKIVLHFIISISGRFSKFENFLMNFEIAVLKQEKRVVLTVMLFKHKTGDRSVETQTIVDKMQEKYPQHLLEVILVRGPFSRAIGLELGSRRHGPDALLVFVDVDIVLHPDSLLRIKLNTIRGKQVYFPIIFSQFDPTVNCDVRCLRSYHTSSPFNYSATAGFWRSISYGMVSTYNCDFYQIGGFDKSIKGWGLEDIKLFNSYLIRNWMIVRAPDPGFVHIFHPKYCDSKLENEQYSMCKASKAVTYLSQVQLSDIVYRNYTLLYKCN